MSWKDKLENSIFEIETGDGKVFKPLWKPGEKSKEFNTNLFDFINVEGTYVGRKKPKSSKYTFVFWFQGEDNIEQAESFEISASDSRAWKVRHPFYGTLNGQPLSISRNDTFLNVTEVTVEFWETITGDGVRRKIAPLDSIKSKGIVFQDVSSQIYSSKVDVKPINQSSVKQNVSNFSLRYNSILDDVNYSDYQASLSKAMQSIDEMILYPVQAIKDINTLINLPSEFQKSVEQRFNLMKEIFFDIKDVFTLGNNRANKSYFEAMAGAILSSMAVTAVSLTSSEFYTRLQIQNLAEDLLGFYRNYLQILDESQVRIEDVSNSFMIGYEGQSVLNTLILEAVHSLYDLAFDARQEREVVLDKDSNLIILTHKYMGLDENDENINTFRKINNIKNKSLFIIRKGRKIKYYI
jgi:hypothetical protein